MKVLVEIAYNYFITVPADHAADLLSILPHIRVAEQSGYGETLSYKVSDFPPNLSFIDGAKLEPLTPNELALQRAYDEKNTQWANAYTENGSNKKRVAELEAELSKLRGESCAN